MWSNNLTSACSLRGEILPPVLRQIAPVISNKDTPLIQALPRAPRAIIALANIPTTETLERQKEDVVLDIKYWHLRHLGISLMPNLKIETPQNNHNCDF